jgi:hypothetical protein
VSGRTLIGVSGSFRAAHRCAEPELHVHEWHVTAWFDAAPRADARLFKAALDMLLGGWEGKPLPVEMEWNEDIAFVVGRLVNCVEVEVRRDNEGLHARWSA